MVDIIIIGAVLSLTAGIIAYKLKRKGCGCGCDCGSCNKKRGE